MGKVQVVQLLVIVLLVENEVLVVVMVTPVNHYQTDRQNDGLLVDFLVVDEGVLVHLVVDEHEVDEQFVSSGVLVVASQLMLVNLYLK